MVEQHPLWSKLVSVVMAAVLGGSLTTIVDNKITNIKQDAKIEQLAELKNNVSTLNRGLMEANHNLAVFSERLKVVQEELHEQSNRQSDGHAPRDGSPDSPRGNQAVQGQG